MMLAFSIAQAHRRQAHLCHASASGPLEGRLDTSTSSSLTRGLADTSAASLVLRAKALRTGLVRLPCRDEPKCAHADRVRISSQRRMR